MQAAAKDESSEEESEDEEEDSDEEMPQVAKPASSKRKAAEVCDALCTRSQLAHPAKRPP